MGDVFNVCPLRLLSSPTSVCTNGATSTNRLPTILPRSMQPICLNGVVTRAVSITPGIFCECFDKIGKTGMLTPYCCRNLDAERAKASERAKRCISDTLTCNATVTVYTSLGMQSLLTLLWMLLKPEENATARCRRDIMQRTRGQSTSAAGSIKASNTANLITVFWPRVLCEQKPASYHVHMQ